MTPIKQALYLLPLYAHHHYAIAQQILKNFLQNIKGYYQAQTLK